MPVLTRSRASLAPRGGDGAAAMEWGSFSAAPAPGRGARRDGVASQNHHQGLKEKLRALTLLHEQHKQLAASQGGAAARELRRSVRRINEEWAANDENARAAAEEESEGAMRHHDAFAALPAPEAAVLRENLAPPQAPAPVLRENLAPQQTPALIAFSQLREQQQKKNENVVPRAGNAMSCPIKKAPAALPKAPMPPTPPARKLSLGGAVGRKRKADVEAVAGDAEAAESRILVFVRLRPMSTKEKEAGSRSCVKIVNNKDVYLTGFVSENDYLRLKRVRGRHFCFDSAFPESTTQAEVYSTSTAELVEGVLQGRNGTVFCYGATGAGKTHTMLGTTKNPGVMVLAIKDLFSKVRQRSHDGNHSIQLSYLEIYNETVRDLLCPGRSLQVREDKQGTVVAGLNLRRAYSTEEVMELLQQGNKNRTTEPTRANETSSRSHAILQVVVEYRCMDGSNIATRVGKLSLIDLAGSERAQATDQCTKRSIEGANINRSLLALSNCINALVEGKKHIPYRDSKLTQLLKDSLGGYCNTVMIANISPCNLSFGETQNTLHWADRAKEIKTKAFTAADEDVLNATDSESDQAKLVLELQRENSLLREQLAKQQQKLLTVQAHSLASNSSPQQSPAPSSHVASPSSAQRKVKRTILAGNCFGTPDSKRTAADNAQVTKLQMKVRTLEAEIEKMKKEHLLQLRQKDAFIRDLINKKGSNCDAATVERKVVTRASLQKSQRDVSALGELKSPSHRFKSPAPTAKKRTFWDIGGNSPSVLAASGRKTRNHVAEETPKKSSMLLQPGFARQRGVN